jgi:hypothetical protein
MRDTPFISRTPQRHKFGKKCAMRKSKYALRKTLALYQGTALQAAEKLLWVYGRSCFNLFMRGDDFQQGAVFSYISAEQRVPQDHPLRAIRVMVDEALGALSSHLDTLYARGGRPSIAPEKLVRALLLQALYSVRCERQLIEQMDYNLLLRWFLPQQAKALAGDPIRGAEHGRGGVGRDRVHQEPGAADGGRSLRAAAAGGGGAGACEESSERGALHRGRNADSGLGEPAQLPEKQDPPDRGTGARGRKLLRDTHESSTDPEARLYRKSSSAAVLPSYLGHVLTENRNGLVVRALATQSSTTAEREAALAMLDRMPRSGPVTLGADTSYQQERFLSGLRERKVAPHVAEYSPNPKWPSFLTEAERSSDGFRISQQKRKRVEKVFGWAKLDRTLRQVKLRGLRRIDWLVQLVAAAYNLRRMQTLLANG